MKIHKAFTIFAAIMVLALLVAPLTYAPNQAAAPAQNQNEPTITYGGTSLRITELNRVLGIPINQLKRLKPEKLRDLMIQNAETLGMRVYEVTIDQDGKQVETLIAGNKVLKAKSYGDTAETESTTEPYPAPDSSEVTTTSGVETQPYPAPESLLENPAYVIPQQDLTQQVETLTLGDYKMYLPITIRSSDPLLESIDAAIAGAKAYVDTQYDSYGNTAVVKENAGCPVGIRSQDDPMGRHGIRLIGDYYLQNIYPVGKVNTHFVGYDYDFSDVDFEAGYNFNYGEPRLECDASYLSDGSVHYTITKVGWYSSDTVPKQDVYFGDGLVFTDVKSVSNGAVAHAFSYPPSGYFSSHRFTIRHATTLGAIMYDLTGEQTKSAALSNSITPYGFWIVPDIYEPLFGRGQWGSDSYFFSNDAYHDCDLINDGIDSTILHGFGPHRYPYESKVCISRAVYISISRLDYLIPALQAIHILNKYGDPNYSYPDPDGVGTVTPTTIARRLESYWNGYGIPVYLKDPQYASGVRTNTFLGLESILGYQYGDTTSKNYADMAALILLNVQWGGIAFDEYKGETYDNGYIFRPMHQGGELLMWKSGGSYPYSLPPRTILTEILDQFNMPNETLMPLPTNSESTLSFWAALTLYRQLRYGGM